MKVTIIALAALCIVQASCKSKMEEIGRHFIRQTRCLRKENLTMHEVEAYVIQGKLLEAEVTPQLKCFGACVLERNGIIRGCKVLHKKIARIEGLSDLHKTLVKCKDEVNAGERCECSHQLLKCFAEQEASQIALN